MKKVLVKGNVDYADEFNLEFFKVFAKDDWDSYLANVKKLFKEIKENAPPKKSEWDDPFEVEVYFGTNECATFKSFSDWFDSLTVVEIDEATAKFFDNTFGGEFGTGNECIGDIFLEILESKAGEEKREPDDTEDE